MQKQKTKEEQRESSREYHRKYYVKHRREYFKNYYIKNKDRINKAKKIYNQTPEAIKLKKTREERRTKKWRNKKKPL